LSHKPIDTLAQRQYGVVIPTRSTKGNEDMATTRTIERCEWCNRRADYMGTILQPVTLPSGKTFSMCHICAKTVTEGYRNAGYQG